MKTGSDFTAFYCKWFTASNNNNRCVRCRRRWRWAKRMNPVSSKSGKRVAMSYECDAWMLQCSDWLNLYNGTTHIPQLFPTFSWQFRIVATFCTSIEQHIRTRTFSRLSTNKKWWLESVLSLCLNQYTNNTYDWRCTRALIVCVPVRVCVQLCKEWFFGFVPQVYLF